MTKVNMLVAKTKGPMAWPTMLTSVVVGCAKMERLTLQLNDSAGRPVCGGGAGRKSGGQRVGSGARL